MKKETVLTYLEHAFVLSGALALSYLTARAGLPFSSQFLVSYLITRTLYDTLRRVHRHAVLLAVALTLSLHALGAQHEQAALMEARLAWRQSDEQAAVACRVPGSRACLDALERERVSAARLCEVSGGAECP